MKAVCETLAGNAHVENLILAGNQMNVEQTQMLQNMMGENSSITFLTLQECRIGEEGMSTFLNTLLYSMKDSRNRRYIFLHNHGCILIMIKKKYFLLLCVK